MNSQEKLQTSHEELMLPFAMSPISPEAEAQAKRGWQLSVNGEVVAEPIAEAALKHSKMGVEVTYGLRPEGYDGFVIRELGGGGAVTIPYMVDKTGDIFIGVVEENRPLLGGKVKNVPRGFMDKGETHKEAAIREMSEETGLRALGSRFIQLTEGLNPNSTFFDTSGSAAEGVSIFALHVMVDELEPTHDEHGNEIYVFPAHVRAQAEGDKTAERILGSRFIPLKEAAASRDMFTSAATGQLLSAMFSGDVPFMAPAN